VFDQSPGSSSHHMISIAYVTNAQRQPPRREKRDEILMTRVIHQVFCAFLMNKFEISIARVFVEKMKSVNEINPS
jgi:hypothetical protein